ncbi:MAG: hypothetical protein KKF12_21270 [Proteobacteria bacterium]|nr:hypothetical protein [Desulfobacula sp.]MBU3951779.1 hypothetical protein [Pseudomonadota bacterium]MBU4133360.1 hypothetical protein [Pseudomonadota bacterium]
MTEEINTMADEINATQGEINSSQAAAAQAVLDAQAEVENCQTELQLAKYEVIKAKGWSESAVGVEVEPGRFSSKHHSYQSDRWANEDRNVEIEPNKFSGKHHAEVAEEFVSNLLLNPIFSESTTSLAVIKGVKFLTTDTGKAYQRNMWMVFISKTNASVWMKGYLNAYDSETGGMEAVITEVSGEGTVEEWLLSQTNPGAAAVSGISTDKLNGAFYYNTMGGF